MNILGTGLSGLVGSRVVELLASHYSFENLSLETGVDITDRKSVNSFFSRSSAPWVFHFAAYTDVQGAEKEKSLGEKSMAWKVNVTATSNIIENCKRQEKHLLYIDTDYSFDGTRKSYTEEDAANPLGWYATTKYEGAKRVLAMGNLGLVVRIANPYRANPVGKKDFVHKMRERLETGQSVIAATDQLFSPTFIDDIAVAVDVLVKRNLSGLYHATGGDGLSPFDAARTIAVVYGYDEKLVVPTKFSQMFANRAPAPQYAYLKNEKIGELGVTMRTFHEGVEEVKRQEIV